MRSEASFWLEKIRALPRMDVKLMEVCGTHTMAIARAGIKSLLPEGVELLSGPGCPVCVTPAAVIDAALALRRRALGARVELVYSPVDAIGLAKNNPGKEVVFLGVGFETTAPGTAAAVLTAREQGVKNFSVWSMLKTVEPALRALLKQEDFAVRGFLCPGHVATVIGAEAFRFLPEEYSIPAVVGGFEPKEILHALYLLLRQIAEGEPKLENAYPRAVRAGGNPLAKRMIDACLEPRRDLWRGLGEIEASGLGWREEFSAWDAEKKFDLRHENTEGTRGCRCGDVICGRCRPADCPMFARRCTPEDPVGPCMVSSEGACAAAYKYQMV